jgi:hypothetical protein
MTFDAAHLIDSILTDARTIQADLERLQHLRSDDPDLQEVVARAKENAVALKRIRDAVEGEGNILEL